MITNTHYRATRLLTTLVLIVQLLLALTVLCLIMGVYNDAHGADVNPALDWVRGVFHLLGVDC